MTVTKMAIAPVIPTEMHGFTVKVGVSRYPPDAPTSHRKAVYAELAPSSPEAHEVMRNLNRERILGIVPITPEAADAVLAEPDGELAEWLALDAVAQASKLARKYMS